jgi:D-alanine-D-alanine ligase
MPIVYYKKMTPYLSSNLKVAVLRGGPSSDYEASLETGAHVLSILRESEEKYRPIDIFISRSGEWHRDGMVQEPHRALRHIDVVWNGLHGNYGEDGQVGSVLERLKIPFTSSSAVPSALAANKHHAKNIFISHNLLTPQHVLLTRDDLNDEILISIFRTYLHPVVVKPAKGSGSFLNSLAHSFQELKDKVREVLEHAEHVLIEERIIGTSVSCSVVEKARGHELYVLLPVADIRSEAKREVEEMSRVSHNALGLRHFSTSDFVVTPRGKVYILETNSTPRLVLGSHLSHSLDAVGWHQRDFVDHCLNLALER